MKLLVAVVYKYFRAVLQVILLVLLYINDLPTYVSFHDVYFILFADNTTCLTPPKRLQEVCNTISIWLKNNELVLSAVQTKHMIFLSQCVCNCWLLTMARESWQKRSGVVVKRHQFRLRFFFCSFTISFSSSMMF